MNESTVKFCSDEIARQNGRVDDIRAKMYIEGVEKLTIEELYVIRDFLTQINVYGNMLVSDLLKETERPKTLGRIRRRK